MAKLLTDASYTKRDKVKEAADAKAGKGLPGYLDMTPSVPVKGK